MKTPWRIKPLQKDFIEQAVAINQKFLRIGAMVVVVVGLFHMMRAFLFTTMELTTLNNQIHFAFYLFSFVCGVIFLILEYCVKLSLKLRYRIYMFSSIVLLYWHMLFNMYNIYRGQASGCFAIMIAMFFFAGLVMLKPISTLVNLGCSYVIFLIYLGSVSRLNQVVAFSVAACICVLTYLSRYRHLCLEIAQMKMLDEMQQELTDVKRDFRLSTEQYALIQEKGKYITFEWDIREDWIRFSKEWNEVFGEPEDIPDFSKYINSLRVISDSLKSDLIQCLENVKNGINFQKYELLLPTQNGESEWFELCVVTQMNTQGEPVQGIGMLANITDQKQKISQLEKEIHMDLFTGVLNKAAIESYGHRKLKELPEGKILAILILDMDDFKRINDRFGHPMGDYVLKEVAKIMRQKAPVGARAGRIGGDEFIVLFLTDSLEEFCVYARTLVDMVSQIEWNGTCIGASCSIGLSAADSREWDYAKLYEAADKALYQAKREGKHRFCCQIENCQQEGERTACAVL